MTTLIGFFDGRTSIVGACPWGRLQLVPERRAARLKGRRLTSDIIWVSDGVSGDVVLGEPPKSFPYRRDLAMFVAASLLRGSSPRLFVSRQGSSGPIEFVAQRFVEVVDLEITLDSRLGKEEPVTGSATSHALCDALATLEPLTILSIRGGAPYPTL